MTAIQFYKRTSGNWGFTDRNGNYQGFPYASCKWSYTGTRITVRPIGESPFIVGVEVTQIQKSETLGDNYLSIADFETSTADFFVNASGDGGVAGTQAQRLTMSPTEGFEFYQTDAGPGKYVYTNGIWEQVSGKGRLYCRKTADQTGVVTNTDISFQMVTGNMTHSSPSITLRAGKTYRLLAALRFTGGSSIDMVYNFVDSSNASLPLSNEGRQYTGTAFTGVVEMAGAVITPVSDMIVKLRCTYANVSATAIGNNNFILVEQIY